MSTPFATTPLEVLLAGRPDRTSILRSFGITLRLEDKILTLRESCERRGVDIDSVAFALWTLDQTGPLAASA